MQQRDIGNEFIVAIAAIGVIAFAVTFAVILSLSNRDSEATPTPTAISAAATSIVAQSTATVEQSGSAASNVPVSSQSATEKSATALVPTRAPTRRPTRTPSPTPSDTDTPLPTDTSTPTPRPSATHTPTITLTPTVTNTPTPVTPTVPPVAEGCTHPGAQIYAPITAEVVTGIVSIVGVASVNDFDYYKIEVRASTSEVYTLYSRSDDAVTRGELGQIETSIFGKGLHWIRLSVIRAGSNQPLTCAIPLIFD